MEVKIGEFVYFADVEWNNLWVAVTKVRIVKAKIIAFDDTSVTLEISNWFGTKLETTNKSLIFENRRQAAIEVMNRLGSEDFKFCLYWSKNEV